MQHPIPAIPSIHCNALGEKRTDRAFANDILLACSVAALRNPGPEQQRDRDDQHHRHDRKHRVGGAPAIIAQDAGQEQRPYGSRQVIAACRDCHRNAPSPVEPVRDIRDQRAEPHRGSEADNELHCRKHQNRLTYGGKAETGCHDHRRSDQRECHPESVDGPPDHQVAQCKADHGQGIGKRGISPRHPELRLHRRHDHDDRPHPDIAENGNGQGDAQPCPRVAAIENIGLSHAVTLLLRLALV
jgi:hypothetical protein